MSGGGDHLRSVHGYDTVVREHWLDVVRHAVENLSTIVLNEVLLCVGVGCISVRVRRTEGVWSCVMRQTGSGNSAPTW